MAREVSIGSMVTLPRLNGASAVALGEQLLTATAAAGELPVFIERPRTRLATAVTALKDELMPKEEADSGAAVAADRKMDRAWRSFSEWLGAMVGMPDGAFADIDKVRALHTMIFGEGLSFIILSFREEWTQSESRLNAITEGGYEAIIQSLGGGPFLSNLKSAHTRYGEALGIKAPVSVTEAPAVRENLDKVSAAMKEYVVKVAAYPDPEEPGSNTLSETLLIPLVQWKGTPSRPSSQAEGEIPPAE